MATQSIPPNLTDDKPNQNQDSEPVESITEEKKVVLGEHARQTSPGSMFVNSEPIREEQVQNAVKFLSHPKVRGSPVMYRRSFLEKKGLTKEEIDEAFLRVPDPAPSVTTTQGNNRNQDRQVEAATNMQQKVSTQAPQPVVARPTGIVSTKMILRPARFHWSHAFLAIGSLVAWGTGTALLFKKVFVPRLKSWVCKVVLGEENGSIKKRDPKPCLAEEVVAAAKAAAAATTEMARASQKMMDSKFEERRYLESFSNVLDVQVDEMKSMSKAIRKLEVMNSPSASVEPAGSSYPEPNKIMAMIQGEEKPPGFKKINDFPLNSNPRLAPQLQPWEISQGQNGSSTKAKDAGPWWQQKTAWVPPQPPPIAMPEAAAAIRQPKSVIQTEQSEAGNHPISHPLSDIAELQRITKISESGGEIEMNKVNTATEVNETQEEQ